MSLLHLHEVFDAHGQSIRLGSRLGQGGEGTVYELSSNDNAVAKIYHHPLTPERAAKIRAMTAMGSGPIGALAAWPITLLQRRTGEAVGLVMPKVVGHKDIHHLYSPKSRRSNFSRANWHFLVRAATNLARAVAAVHESGCVIGDVNPSGVLVAQDAQIRLIDCDSFQISADGRQFLCHVGVPHFTPPELQERNLANVVRTTDHDNFGLAVLIFLVLFMGRHPFAGRFLGSGDMPIEQAIAEYRFVYGANRAAAAMEQPPGTPSLDIASRDVALLFERAFGPHTPPGGRPTARDWMASLGALEKKLTQCPFNSSHVHLADLPTCPWCEMEAKSRVPLFPLGPTRSNVGPNLDEIWKQVATIAHPGPTTPIENPEMVQSLPVAQHVRKLKVRRAARPVLALLLVAAIPALAGFYVVLEAALVSAAAGLAASALAWRGLSGKREIEGLLQTRKEAEQRWKEVGEHWNERAGAHHFDSKRLELDELWKKLEALPNERLRRLNDLMARRRETQLEEFLDRFDVPTKGIPGIGPVRKVTLQSYGIETAGDINDQKLVAVPGIGPARSAALLAWRKGIEEDFQFDPSKGIDPQDQLRVEQEISGRHKAFAEQLQKASAELKQIGEQIAWMRNMRNLIEAEYRQYAQAMANARALGR